MDTEELVVKAIDDFASRVAQCSTLSGNAAPFMPSFLRSAPEASLEQLHAVAEGAGGTTGALNTSVEQTVVAPLEYSDPLCCDYERQVHSVGVSSALTDTQCTARKDLRSIEGYLLDVAVGCGIAMANADDEDERLFVNDDDDIAPEEEEWIIEQMLES
ncbi:hypothetical protein ERJ75_001727500 [Trypanosoma vivax]|nr:hypothetical protein TRVL_00910 [Trypanosoma vivax]KAH8604094.1 hypothetical protein ERJ75_001727500 [Trypanosoma vivax]